MSFNVTVTGDVGDCIATCCETCTVVDVWASISWVSDSDLSRTVRHKVFTDETGGAECFSTGDLLTSPLTGSAGPYKDSDADFIPSQIGRVAGAGQYLRHSLFISAGGTLVVSASAVLKVTLSDGSIIEDTISLVANESNPVVELAHNIELICEWV